MFSVVVSVVRSVFQGAVYAFTDCQGRELRFPIARSLSMKARVPSSLLPSYRLLAKELVEQPLARELALLGQEDLRRPVRLGGKKTRDGVCWNFCSEFPPRLCYFSRNVNYIFVKTGSLWSDEAHREQKSENRQR